MITPRSPGVGQPSTTGGSDTGTDTLCPYFQDDTVTLYTGDALDVVRQLPKGSVHCVVTSPPYWRLRNYGVAGQWGNEPSPTAYIDRLRTLFAELARVLDSDGTVWLNLADTYAASGGDTDHGHTSTLQGRRVRTAQNASPGTGGTADRKPKNLLGIPWRTALALQDDDWYLRNAIIWHKPNAMPQSASDRLSSRYEHVFLLTKSHHYWFDLDAIREPQETLGERHNGRSRFRSGHPSQQTDKNAGDGWRVDATPYPDGMRPQPARAATGKQHNAAHRNGSNPGDVWDINNRPFPGAHFAVFPPDLPQRCILAGCKPGGTVLDPFSGSGTTGLAAQRTGRRYIGVDINPKYLDLTLRTRLRDAALHFDTDIAGHGSGDPEAAAAITAKAAGGARRP